MSGNRKLEVHVYYYGTTGAYLRPTQCLEWLANDGTGVSSRCPYGGWRDEGVWRL
jgi:hypothetical protein